MLSAIRPSGDGHLVAASVPDGKLMAIASAAQTLVIFPAGASSAKVGQPARRSTVLINM
ncbi:hypothetical protein [Nonomuraea sp. NPDC049400]|uniref:hypothetical protein n=1 Tax=Nonomuraea sp. NPDC049400 TaxID=3364352 RepID=UPI00379EFBDD